MLESEIPDVKSRRSQTRRFRGLGHEDSEISSRLRDLKHEEAEDPDAVAPKQGRLAHSPVVNSLVLGILAVTQALDVRPLASSVSFYKPVDSPS